MVDAQTLEVWTRGACGISLFIFMFIATFSRNESAETFAQRSLSASSLIAAILCAGLVVTGGEFYGSKNLPYLMTLICLVVAIGATLNLKGKQISQGMNPHQIMRMLDEEE